MKIPVKETIISGDWLQCCLSTYLDGEMVFRFKPVSFERINMHSIDEPQELKLDQGILWLLKIEVVNFTKKPIVAHRAQKISLLDHDDFTFDTVNDDHLTSRSKYATLTGLDRYNGWSSTPTLLPKIKTAGAIAYLLPDDDQADYFFTIIGGSLRAL